jgi:hypothetical protein
MSEGPPVRRLALVPRPSEPPETPFGGAAAVRRYRLARMERVDEESPPGAGSRSIPGPDGRPAEGA